MLLISLLRAPRGGKEEDKGRKGGREGEGEPRVCLKGSIISVWNAVC